MSKVINITDKLSLERPRIQIGDKSYEVDNSIETVFKFQELSAQGGNEESMTKAITLAIGEEAANELNITQMSIANYKVLTIAILAAMQELEYEEIESTFR